MANRTPWRPSSLGRQSIGGMLVRILVLWASILDVTSMGDLEANKLLLTNCCHICKSLFGEPLHRISNCTYDKNNGGEFVQCGKLDSSSGLHLTRLACNEWNSALFSQCSKSKAPSINCKRTRDRTNDAFMTLNCTWTNRASASGGGRDCPVSLDWPMLFSHDFQSGYVPEHEATCDDSQQCSVLFSYPKSSDQESHCPGDKVSFTGKFGRTGIRANLLYELNRLEGTVLPEDAISMTDWSIDERLLTFRFAVATAYSKENACAGYHLRKFYCRLGALDDRNSTATILYSPMQFSPPVSDEQHEQRTIDDIPEASSAYCQFDMDLQILSLNNSPSKTGDRATSVNLRFYSSTYESRKYSINLNSKSSTSVDSESAAPTDGGGSHGAAPLSVFAIAACILAFPVFLALVLCLVWIRKRCKSPCTAYKDCVEKKKLRRTADWVDLVQTQWLQKSLTSAPTSNGGADCAIAIPNLDTYQLQQTNAHTPTSSALATPECTRSDRSVHWREIREIEDEFAPSLKRPLMPVIAEQRRKGSSSAMDPQDDLLDTDQRSLDDEKDFPSLHDDELEKSISNISEPNLTDSYYSEFVRIDLDPSEFEADEFEEDDFDRADLPLTDSSKKRRRRYADIARNSSTNRFSRSQDTTNTEYVDAEDTVPELSSEFHSARRGDRTMNRSMSTSATQQDADEISFVTAFDLDPRCTDRIEGNKRNSALIQMV